ncbi:hypothetical protein FGB62_248g06 [Gracilaria domingensis]|nr:hypothetical protein FGB62_248g06 [Gracilaria domingensis]
MCICPSAALADDTFNEKVIITCSSTFQRRCFDQNSECYRCTQDGNLIVPPEGTKILLFEGDFIGLQQKTKLRRPVYSVTATAFADLGSDFDPVNGKFVEIRRWKNVARGEIRCIRTRPVGWSFGSCCGACSYRNGVH